MELGLKGKVVVITGGTSGIGKSAAVQFAKEECKVAVCGRNLKKLTRMEDEFIDMRMELFAKEADASNYDALLRFADGVVNRFGKIDVWINNAGIMPLKHIIDMDVDEWDLLFNNNLKSTFLGCKIAAEKMKDKGGVILNASSLAARIPSVGGGAYGASKAAILNLTWTLAAELAPLQIRVNAYCPGVTATDLTRDYLNSKGEQNVVEQIALKRIASTEDIADVIVIMASDVTRYITGASLEISGGKLSVQNPQVAWHSQIDCVQEGN